MINLFSIFSFIILVWAVLAVSIGLWIITCSSVVSIKNFVLKITKKDNKNEKMDKSRNC